MPVESSGVGGNAVHPCQPFVADAVVAVCCWTGARTTIAWCQRAVWLSAGDDLIDVVVIMVVREVVLFVRAVVAVAAGTRNCR